MLRGYATIIYLFLYAPIALIVLFSFNAQQRQRFQHFAVLWYGKAAHNTFVIEALENSAIVASTSASLATIMGTWPHSPCSGSKDRCGLPSTA